MALVSRLNFHSSVILEEREGGVLVEDLAGDVLDGDEDVGEGGGEEGEDRERRTVDGGGVVFVGRRGSLEKVGNQVTNIDVSNKSFTGVSEVVKDENTRGGTMVFWGNHNITTSSLKVSTTDIRRNFGRQKPKEGKENQSGSHHFPQK